MEEWANISMLAGVVLIVMVPHLTIYYKDKV